ncbi:hypothetical protein N8I77_004705 [Diaporthe amygdali]|uniref:Uncharacterized protein n=1 Tax=Phomopsis amygdali TaxID=1214568 RepID=A0AAD9SMK6_PHOAM|nr:hypothetical protein N8I77_004705 [Diaporthe amygdali]
MTILSYRTRRENGYGFRPAHEYTIMFKLAGGDYYHMPATKVQQICPGLQGTIEQAVQDGTAMTDVFEIPRLLEQEWKDWWTINDYIVQGCELTTYEPLSSFLTDAQVHILATHYAVPAGVAAAAAAIQQRAADILVCLVDTTCLFDEHEARAHLESLVAAAKLAFEPGSSSKGRAGLRTVVAAACATLCPLLEHFPAFRAAAMIHEGVAELWDGLEAERCAAVGQLGPEVKERISWVVEGCDQ